MIGDIDFAAAVNDEAVLTNCLKRSPDLQQEAARLRTYVGFKSAGEAYNCALDESEAPYLVLLHQDIYLPRGFLDKLRTRIAELNRIDPDWAVAGPIGLGLDRIVKGAVWSSGIGAVVGQPVAKPIETICLDELLFVVRKASRVRFDTNLPGFHMYGLDVVLSAIDAGMKSYVIDLPVVHHSRPVISLSGGYHKAYAYIRSKWRKSLPIPNLVCTVYPTDLWFTWRNWKMHRRHRGVTDRAEPTGDPAAIAQTVGFEA